MKDSAVLISNHFNGKNDPADDAELRAYILERPEHAHEFMRAAMLHNALADYFRTAATNDADGPLSIKESNNLSAMTDERSLSSQTRSKTLKRRLTRPWLAAAAALILVVLGVALYLYYTLPVATVQRVVNAKWQYMAPTPGQMIPRRTLKLRSGYAEFSFPNGATVLVQGPAEFRLQSSNSIRLIFGRLTTSIPPAAAGFTINVPSASVVDLGTEIGVQVDEDNEAFVEVFKGRAGVRLTKAVVFGPRERILTPGMAVDVKGDQPLLADAALRPTAFTLIKQLDDAAREATTILPRWTAFTKDMCDDASLVAYYGSASDGDRLINEATLTRGEFDGKLVNTRWTEGRFPGTKALTFNGQDSRVEINIAKPLPSLTIAAWIDMHALEHPYASIMMSDGAKRLLSCHFQFVHIGATTSISFSNPTPDSPRPWNNYRFPPVDLLSVIDKWHFIAIVYDTQHARVSCWLDGKLLESRKLLDVKPLLIGRARIGDWNSTTLGRRAFNGSIDGLAIWRRPLGPAEIDSIYKAGLPVQSQ